MPTLKEMLGDSYKEGMTFDDVANFFEGKNYADLSTGNYVGKDKFDNQVNTLTNQLKETKNQLNAKLTDDEKVAEHEKAQADRIAELEKLLNDNTIASNKTLANNTLTNVRDMLGIKSTDKEYNGFINSMVTEDGTKTNAIADYVSKLVNESYKKGKQDAVKDSMGQFGTTKGQGNIGDGIGNSEIGSLGKKLAESNIPKKEQYDYFK